MRVNRKHICESDREVVAWFVGDDAMPAVRCERHVVAGHVLDWQVFIRGGTAIDPERALLLAAALDEAATVANGARVIEHA